MFSSCKKQSFSAQSTRTRVESASYLDVSVDDSSAVALEHDVHHLPEEVPRHVLGQEALAADEVEEIPAGLRALQDEDEGVVVLEHVEQADDARHRGHLAQQRHLQRDAVTARLKVSWARCAR